MTKDTIQRAIDRGAGGGDNDNLEELTYEYGPGGVAVLVEVMTDNKIVPSLRYATRSVSVVEILVPTVL